MAEQRLGDMLLGCGAITPAQLDEAILVQNEQGQLLGDTLVALGYVSEDKLAVVLAEQLGYQRGLPTGRILQSDVTDLVDDEFIERYGVLPLSRHDGAVLVGTVDPVDITSLDAMRRAVAPTPIRITVLTPTEFEAARETRASVLINLSEVLRAGQNQAPGRGTIETGADDGPAARLVASLLNQAVRARASDIHIEPSTEDTQVRMRVDGMMSNVTTIPRAAHAMVISRIKILAELDIAIRQRPQDGHYRMHCDEKAVDLRISVLPVIGGEKVVVRVLDGGESGIGLDDMGFDPGLLGNLRGLLDRPQGIIVVTGPTGSGKTTTLYGGLQYLKDKNLNITTIEDPVEQNVEGLNQSQINPKQDFTFANGLRAILRQDPDVIMVGETRDLETAVMAFQAALTGHLVLTTVHTNDAASAVTRLIDLGLEPYMVASSLIGVLAQRLVRRVCPDCSEITEIHSGDRRRLQQLAPDSDVPTSERHPVGDDECATCDGARFRGRTSVAELLEVDERIAALVADVATDSEIRRAAVAAGMSTMQEVGLSLVRSGVTTASEILRAIPPAREAARVCGVAA